MASLILEGGSFRGIFSAGVMDGFLELGIEFPYVIGVSAGMANAAAYLSKQKGRNMELTRAYRNDPRYFGLHHFLTDRSIFGVEFVFETIPQELVPFDYETFRNYPGKVYGVVTNAETGKAEYLDVLKQSKHSEVFKATCSIPGLFEGELINGVRYFDGGVADSIPVVKAMNDGNKKHVIVLTQPDGYVKEFDTKTKMIAMAIGEEYPNLAYRLTKRADIYNLQLALCKKLEEEGKALIIRPAHPLNSLEDSIEKLEDTYEEGKQWVLDHKDELFEFIKED